MLAILSARSPSGQFCQTRIADATGSRCAEPVCTAEPACRDPEKLCFINIHPVHPRPPAWKAFAAQPKEFRR